MPTDSIDAKILAILRDNARIATADLARQVGRSRTTVQGRIERLEREGVIVGYAARVSSDFEASAVKAYVMIKLGPKEAKGVEAAAKALPEVRMLHSVSGEYDMIAVAAAPSVAAMDKVIDRLGELPGVERTTSSILLSTKFER